MAEEKIPNSNEVRSNLVDLSPVFYWDQGDSSHHLTWHSPLKEGNYFNGKKCYASTPSTEELKLGVNQTIMLWFRAAVVPADFVRLVGKGSTDQRNYGLWLSPGGNALFQFHWDFMADAVGGNFEVDEWTHFAATYEGSVMKVYLNGQLVVSNESHQVPRTSKDPLTLGFAGYNAHFKGNMEAVYVFNKTFEQEQISECMAKTAPPVEVKVLKSPQELGPVFYWFKGESSHKITWTGLGDQNFFNGVDSQGVVKSTDALKLKMNKRSWHGFAPQQDLRIGQDWSRKEIMIIATMASALTVEEQRSTSFMEKRGGQALMDLQRFL
jgi:hypothetical protein